MDTLWTTRQTAAFLNISPVTVSVWRQHGKGPRYIKINAKSVRYSPDDVKAWVEARKKQGRS